MDPLNNTDKKGTIGHTNEVHVLSVFTYLVKWGWLIGVI
jgi:hypothetical protein